MRKGHRSTLKMTSRVFSALLVTLVFLTMSLAVCAADGTQADVGSFDSTRRMFSPGTDGLTSEPGTSEPGTDGLTSEPGTVGTAPDDLSSDDSSSDDSASAGALSNIFASGNGSKGIAAILIAIFTMLMTAMMTMLSKMNGNDSTSANTETSGSQGADATPAGNDQSTEDQSDAAGGAGATAQEPITASPDETTDATTAPADEATDETPAPADEATDATTATADEATDETPAPAEEATDETPAPADEATDATTAPAETTDETPAPETTPTTPTAATTATVTKKLGDGTKDVTLTSSAPQTILFSTDLSEAGKTAVTNAITAGASASPTYSWTNDHTLEISGHDSNSVFANDVIATITDVAGNQTADVTLIDSSSDEVAPTTTTAPTEETADEATDATTATAAETTDATPAPETTPADATPAPAEATDATTAPETTPTAATTATVTKKLGDGTKYVTITSTAPQTIIFSADLSAAGKTAVTNAITAQASALPTYSWTDDHTLEITGHASNSVFTNDVTATITDVSGNQTEDATLIDSSEETVIEWISEAFKDAIDPSSDEVAPAEVTDATTAM